MLVRGSEYRTSSVSCLETDPCFPFHHVGAKHVFLYPRSTTIFHSVESKRTQNIERVHVPRDFCNMAGECTFCFQARQCMRARHLENKFHRLGQALTVPRQHAQPCFFFNVALAVLRPRKQNGAKSELIYPPRALLQRST